MAAYGLTTTDVTSALQEQNVQVAAGQLNGPPAAPGAAFQLVVQSQGRFQSPEQFADVIVKASDGRLVRVRDMQVCHRRALFVVRHGAIAVALHEVVALGDLQVLAHHLAHQFVEAHPRLPPQLAARLAGVAQQRFDFGGTEIARIDAHDAASEIGRAHV